MTLPSRTLRVNGRIDDDDTRHRIISARVPGRIERLDVTYLGQKVEAGAPLATHLALQWQDDGSPHGVLVGHLARANGHWRLFARAAESLAMFWGPHAYVSPTWYAPGPKVPTWNYVTVHAYGRPEIVSATPAVLMVLTKLAATYEGSGADAWGLGRLPPGAAAEQTKHIVTFRMKIERMETKLKLSQNRDLEDRQRVIARLEASDGDDARNTARWMKRVLP